MSERKVEDPGLYNTLLQSTIKFDETLKLIVNLVQAQCTMLVASQIAHGESQDAIDKTLDNFQSFINLMEFTAEGIVHLFRGFVTGHLTDEEAVGLYMELAAVHDERGSGLISERLNSNGLFDAAMEVMNAMSVGRVDDGGVGSSGNVFKFTTAPKDGYGPN